MPDKQCRGRFPFGQGRVRRREQEAGVEYGDTHSRSFVQPALVARTASPGRSHRCGSITHAPDSCPGHRRAPHRRAEATRAIRGFPRAASRSTATRPSRSRSADRKRAVAVTAMNRALAQSGQSHDLRQSQYPQCPGLEPPAAAYPFPSRSLPSGGGRSSHALGVPS